MTFASKTAWHLLETRSVLCNGAQPFKLTSGKFSPVYVDIRRLIGFTKARGEIMDMAAALLKEKIGADHIDYLAGGETAGIPYAAFLAERLQKPMVYVRKQPKGFGRMNQIEGYFPEDGAPRTVLVEDLQTDGGSKKVFVDALRNAGAQVDHAFVVFHYGIFKASAENMKAMGLNLHALCTWHDVLAAAKETNAFDTHTLNTVEHFLNDPVGWQDHYAQKTA
ncbi:MAG: orotate phosphoribosyltransferase [Alphaproteobacteria bacterium]|nr:orotate phosphoribosyltransferase [Alphaproteobacteria bacterium]